jgi:putative ABC transport system permease protein
MRPPYFAEKLIHWLCRDSLADEILGDLHEEYQSNFIKKGKTRAAVQHWISALRFINARTLKRNNRLNNNAMLKNYITIAFRNIARQKLYSVINIGGLAIGIACSILLGLYVLNELSYDQFHENASQIVKANMEYDMDGTIGEVSSTPTALLPSMQEKFPEVNTGARLFYPSMFKPVVVSYGDKAFQEKGFCYADSTFFKMFSFSLTKGDISTVLDQPNNIVLTESSKEKYFGDMPAMNQILIVEGKSFKITGIMEDVPSNSSIQFDFLASFSSYWQKDPIWYSANYYTYVEMNQLIDTEVLSSKIQTELQKAGISDPDNGRYFGIKFTPLLDIHLYSDVDEGGGDVKNLYIFGSIALLILLIAVINYTNLTIARSFYRAKEVGLRKSLGAYNHSVFAQIIGESFVTVLMAMILSLILLYFMLPLFTTVSGSKIEMSVLLKPIVYWSLGIMYFLISILAGIYPAMKMAGFNPVDILKGKYQGTGQGAILRKSLIVVQFFISLSLIIATVVIYKQLNFINEKNLGYNKENILVIPVSKEIVSKSAEFKSVVLANDNVNAVSIVGETPPNIQGGYSIDLPGDKSVSVVAVAIDESYIETSQMTLVAGRTISLADMKRTIDADEYSFIINESASKTLGWLPEEAIGQNIKMNGREGQIRGVVNDFHFRALYQEVTPLVLFTEHPWAYNYAMVSINGQNVSLAIDAVEKEWHMIDEATPFSFNFLDQEFNNLHVDTSRSSKLLSAFSVLAIMIASLGLFGIVSFSMVQRAKEIGVRKVLGATVTNVLVLANKEVLFLIMLAFILAIPVSYWAMGEWLSTFAYHVNIGVLPMILGLLFTLIIAICTISFESVRAALVNPIETLRNE